MKKTKQGFTLIELLAAIIIIIIIIAIAVPLIFNMIEIAKREAFRATAYSIADSGRLLVASENESQGYQEFYYLDGIEYNADDWKLDYSGKGPKTGIVVINKKNKVVLAIHNGTYCATKSADTNTVSVTKTLPEDCNTYSIVETCDTWEKIALQYDVNLEELLAYNDESDPNSSTCDRDIKIPIASTNAGGSYASEDGQTVYYKTYYTVGYVSTSVTLPYSYEYTIKLGALPLPLEDIKVTRVTMESVFESLDDFKRYITKRNMGEVIWQGGDDTPIDISQASVLRDYAARNANMTADDVTVMCDDEACYATVKSTLDNLTNVNLNTIEGVGQVSYAPVKFTVEFNGEGEICAVMTTTDAEPGVLAGTGTIEDPYLIESIEDLVALSNNVNAGNTYSGKYISLANSFDFKNKNSYKDFSTTVYGDINGNGTPEGLLIELTTGAGFMPIGNGSVSFRGIIRGNQHCLSNLYIYRPDTDYVGLFGYSRGTISGLNLSGVNITGHNRVGGVAGCVLSSGIGKVLDMEINGNVIGNNDVGLAVGHLTDYTSASYAISIIVNGNVTGTDYVGGIVGNNNKSIVAGINVGGAITSTGNNVGRLDGNGGTVSGYAYNTVTVNGSTINETLSYSKNGANISSLAEVTSNINSAEAALDTYIGGDEGSDGYYWDYNDSGILVKKNTTQDPIKFNLSGGGTIESPYLISSYEDLKQATLKLSSVYKLTFDIDLTGKNFYMLGSHINKFTGTFYGNNKTISNLTIDAPKTSYIGFTGDSRGFISCLNLMDIDIKGNNYTAGIAGFLLSSGNGKILDSTIQGNIKGNNYVGLAAGYISDYTSPSYVTSIIANGNVTGTDNVGGIVGYNHRSVVAGVNTGGNIISTGIYVGRIAGNGETVSGYAYNTVTVNGSISNETFLDSKNGTSISSLSDVINNINAAEQVLDTYIGGDEGSDGYYWDYDDSGTLVKKNTTQDPINFNLSGRGTTAEPYLISSYDDLKQATLKLNSVFKLISDIDLKDKNFYMLGSHLNKFTGTFYGNNKTISNLTIDAPKASYIGFIGDSRGRVSGLNLSNIDIRANNYVAGIAGFLLSSGNGKILDSTIQGDVIGNNYVGLAAGYISDYTSSSYVTSLIVNGNVTGTDYVGGIVGYNHRSVIAGINTGGNIISAGVNAGRIDGNGGTVSGSSINSVTVNGVTVVCILNEEQVPCTNAGSKNGADITSSDLSNTTTYTDRGFNFSDETQDYIWYIDGGTAKFREGSL